MCENRARVRLPRLGSLFFDGLTPDGATAARSSAQMWMALGAASLAAAAVVALTPGRMQDYHEVREWFAAWGFGAANPYLRLDLDVDYPPHAFLLLAPIGLLPEGLGGRLAYLLFNLATTVAAAYLLVQWSAGLARVTFRPDQIRALTGMVLALGTTRASLWLGQTIALAVCLSLVSMRLADRRPVWAALALSLASFKPHIVVGFALILLLTGRVRLLIYAAVLSAALFTVFGLTVGSPPAEMVAIYLANLDRLYSGAAHVMSVTSLREGFDAIAGPVLGLRLHVAASAAALAWIVFGARRGTARGGGELLVAAACLLWALMALPHQRHSLILLVPAWWAAIWPQTGFVGGTRTRQWIVLAAVSLTVLDLPLLLRLAGEAVARSGTAAAAADVLREASYDVSRCLVVVFFVLVAGSLTRRGGMDGGGRSRRWRVRPSGRPAPGRSEDRPFHSNGASSQRALSRAVR